MELTNEHLRLVFEYEGEGWGGDFDQSDPGDDKLLRFSLYARDPGDSSRWVDIPGTSYCTALPASTPHHLQHLIAESMLAEFTSTFTSSPPESMRGLARFFSWISPSDTALLDTTMNHETSLTQVRPQ
jgi:hypothetical protein